VQALKVVLEKMSSSYLMTMQQRWWLLGPLLLCPAPKVWVVMP
jgi:hypothetical protein